MNRVLVPVIGVGIVYVIAQGWLTTLWQNLYNLAHSGGGINPGTGIQSPGSIISGIPTSGADLPQDPSGNAISKLPGTYNPSTFTFTPNNSSIAPFKCQNNPLGCVMTPTVWAQIRGRLGL